MLVSLIMGWLIGFAFSLTDIEDVKSFETIEMRLARNEKYCYLMAPCLGLISGVINEYLRIRNNFTPFLLSDSKMIDPFCEEI
jgi:hypothetical protein